MVEYQDGVTSSDLPPICLTKDKETTPFHYVKPDGRIG